MFVSLRRHLAAPALSAFVMMTALSLLPAQAADEPAVSPAERAKIESVIKDYLMKNPGIVMEAAEKWRAESEQREQQAAAETLAKRGKDIRNDPDSFAAGNLKGDVTVVEFFDYNCGYCKRSLEGVMNLIKQDPGVKVVFKEFPILSNDSIIAAKAAIAAKAQGKYMDFHARLMAANGKIDEARVMAVAKEAGLDTTRLKMDMAGPDTDRIIKENHETARALKITGTPTFIIGDKVVPGAEDLESLKKLVAEARKSCKTC